MARSKGTAHRELMGLIAKIKTWPGYQIHVVDFLKELHDSERIRLSSSGYLYCWRDKCLLKNGDLVGTWIGYAKYVPSSGDQTPEAMSSIIDHMGAYEPGISAGFNLSFVVRLAREKVPMWVQE